MFTGQWADVPLEQLAKDCGSHSDCGGKCMGFDGLELACWGDHFQIPLALTELNYCDAQRKKLAKHGLGVWAISNHLVGQATLDPVDERHQAILPPEIWGDGNPAGVRERAVKNMKDAALAAKRLGVSVVNGFTGSPIWQYIYSFPPVTEKMIEDGYRLLREVWMPILDEFGRNGVRFALEVHPTEIAFDTYSAERTLDALDHHDCFGFNFDPSHLAYQGVDYVGFIRRFRERIFHVHMKDVWWGQGDGSIGVFGGHSNFGDPRR
jgi:sugar phosphate isomerase/epimerase